MHESMPKAAPLADVTRGPAVESRHVGHGVVVDRHGRVVAQFGDPARLTTLRSSGKPIQALAGVQAGAIDAFGIGVDELAVICGSHRGEAFHLAAVRSILAKLGLAETNLQCGPHPPGDPESARRLLAAGGAPRPIHNNCSGKHAGMLTLTRHLKADVAGYLDPDQPAQQHIARTMSSMLETEPADLPRGVDGCGAPVWAAPLGKIAGFYARLAMADAATASEADLATVRAAMTAHPEMVSGTQGLDTVLMRAGHGDIVAKGGAEGLRCIGVRSRGLGIAVRCEDGATRGLDPILPDLLTAVDAIDPDVAAALREAFPAFVRNWAGAVVGTVVSTATWQTV